MRPAVDWKSIGSGLAAGVFPIKVDRENYKFTDAGDRMCWIIHQLLGFHNDPCIILRPDLEVELLVCTLPSQAATVHDIGR